MRNYLATDMTHDDLELLAPTYQSFEFNRATAHLDELLGHGFASRHPELVLLAMEKKREQRRQSISDWNEEVARGH
jgi:hypothetical protein